MSEHKMKSHPLYLTPSSQGCREGLPWLGGRSGILSKLGGGRPHLRRKEELGLLLQLGCCGERWSVAMEANGRHRFCTAAQLCSKDRADELRVLLHVRPWLANEARGLSVC